MENKLNTVVKISKVAAVICKVVSILCIVGASLCLAGVIIFAFFGDFELSVGGVTLSGLINNEAGMSTKDIAVSVICAALECVFGAVLFTLANSHFKHDVEAGTPFSSKSGKEIRLLGILSLAFSLAESIITSAIINMTNSSADVSTEFNITLGVALILISFVFEYGAVLEKRAKERSMPEEE